MTRQNESIADQFEAKGCERQAILKRALTIIYLVCTVFHAVVKAVDFARDTTV